MAMRDRSSEDVLWSTIPMLADASTITARVRCSSRFNVSSRTGRTSRPRSMAKKIIRIRVMILRCFADMSSGVERYASHAITAKPMAARAMMNGSKSGANLHEKSTTEEVSSVGNPRSFSRSAFKVFVSDYFSWLNRWERKSSIMAMMPAASSNKGHNSVPERSRLISSDNCPPAVA